MFVYILSSALMNLSLTLPSMSVHVYTPVTCPLLFLGKNGKPMEMEKDMDVMTMIKKTG
jgi:hypothetical protein